MTGLFIAIEGADAAGKCTQAKLLKKHYEALGKNVTKFEMPTYESISGQIILDHLQGRLKAEYTPEDKLFAGFEHEPVYRKDPSAYVFQCCFAANRMECTPDGVFDRQDDEVYIADRYVASGYAYGSAHGIDFEWLVRVQRFLPQPDLTVFLDIPIEESFRRRPERRDEYEKDVALLERVRDSYIDVFDRLGPSYVTIDALGTEEGVFASILAELEAV